MRQGYCKPDCGQCCKLIALQVHPQYYEQEDVRHWIELHGIKLERRENGGVWAYIPSACSELQPDNSCGLYGKPERPDVCLEWPFNQAEIDDLDKQVGEKTCTYSFVSADSLVEEVDV